MAAGMCHRGAMNAADPPFWRGRPLASLTETEWEALCDRCGRCCLIKLRDEDTDEVLFTDVACRMLDRATGRCTCYADRLDHVPDCVVLSPATVHKLDWMPSSCAYRRLRDGGDLPAWHPLRTGDPDSVRRAGVSVAGRVVDEDSVPDEDALIGHMVAWPDEDPTGSRS